MNNPGRRTITYAEFCGQLLADGKKGQREQREFLEDARNSDSFLRMMQERLGERATPASTQFPGKLDEPEFVQSPEDTEAKLFEAWEDTPQGIASASEFWLRQTLGALRQGVIGQASWLAMDTRSRGTTGLKRIEKALGGAGTGKAVDDCVRTVLRQAAGLPQRGHRSLLVDCPFARAWWRERLIREAARGHRDSNQERLHRILRQTKANWETVAEALVSRSNVFGLDSVQAAALTTISHWEDPNARDIKDLVRGVCEEAAALELGVLEPGQIRAITDRVGSAVVARRGQA